MNKEAIEKRFDALVIKNNGIFPENGEYDVHLTDIGAHLPVSVLRQRARELGYVNGYRWGVEYPTNGKKPDLAYDVEIDCYYDNEWNSAKVYHIDWTDCGFSSVVTKFKITDQRYKPVDTSYLDSVSEIPESKSNAENVSDWYDYEAQRAIALPPVGEKVEVFLHWSESWSGWVVIVGHDHDGVIWRNGSDNKSYIYSPRSEIRPLDYATRKAEAEKKRVVDAAYDEAIKAGCVDFGQWLSHLYDAGYLKLPAE